MTRREKALEDSVRDGVAERDGDREHLRSMGDCNPEWRSKGSRSMGDSNPEWRSEGSRWLEMARDGSRWLEKDREGSRWLEMARDGSRWLEMARDGSSTSSSSKRVIIIREGHHRRSHLVAPPCAHVVPQVACALRHRIGQPRGHHPATPVMRVVGDEERARLAEQRRKVRVPVGKDGGGGGAHRAGRRGEHSTLGRGAVVSTCMQGRSSVALHALVLEQPGRCPKRGEELLAQLA